MDRRLKTTASLMVRGKRQEADAKGLRMCRRQFMKLTGVTAAALSSLDLFTRHEEVMAMLSELPINMEKLTDKDLDREILRAAIIAELDAVNLYEQMAAMTKDKHIREVMLDVAKEEKTHVGEFQAMLLRKDEEQKKELLEGEKEVKEMLGR